MVAKGLRLAFARLPGKVSELSRWRLRCRMKLLTGFLRDGKRCSLEFESINKTNNRNEETFLGLILLSRMAAEETLSIDEIRQQLEIENTIS